jgi:hypothetical protein
VTATMRPLPGSDRERYPIASARDVEKAVRATGRTDPAKRPAVRRHIIAQARRLGCTHLIPDSWNSDGTLKNLSDTERERVLELAGRWKHNWIPLDAIAAAIKAKQMKGDGVRRPRSEWGITSRPTRPAGKTRFDVQGARQHAALTSGVRGKARPPGSRGARAAAPSTDTPDQIKAKAAEAVRLPRAELTARAQKGDPVARAELDRRAAKKGTPEHIRKMDVRQLRAELTGKSDVPASERTDVPMEASGRARAQHERQQTAGGGQGYRTVEGGPHTPPAAMTPTDRADHADRLATIPADVAEFQRVQAEIAAFANNPGHPRDRSRWSGDTEQHMRRLEHRRAAVRDKLDMAREDGYGREVDAALTSAGADRNAATNGGRAASQDMRAREAPKATEATSPAPVAPTPTAETPKRTRKPSALHAEYRELKRQQDLRVEAATRGALHAGVGGGSKKDSEEVLAYFGEGEHMGVGVEPRLTYRRFLEERRSGTAHQKASAAAYDAGVKLGRKHAAEPSSARHDAEFAAVEAQHHADHRDMVAGGYNDGVIAGEAAKTKREASQQYKKARTAADRAGSTAQSFDTPANSGSPLVAARHRDAAKAHAEAGRLALAAGDRNTAASHLSQAQEHVARADRHTAQLQRLEAEAATRRAEAAARAERSNRLAARRETAVMGAIPRTDAEKLQWTRDQNTGHRVSKHVTGEHGGAAATLEDARQTLRSPWTSAEQKQHARTMLNQRAETVYGQAHRNLAGKSDEELARMLRDNPLASSNMDREQRRGIARVARERLAARNRAAETPEQTAARIGMTFPKPTVKGHAVIGEGATVERSVNKEHPPGIKPGDRVILHNVGVSGDRQGTYVGLDVNGVPRVRSAVGGRMVEQSISEPDKLRPAGTPATPPAGEARRFGEAANAGQRADIGQAQAAARAEATRATPPKQGEMFGGHGEHQPDMFGQPAAAAPGSSRANIIQGSRLQVGDRVRSEFGSGHVTEATDRSIVYKLDSGESLRVQRGTPGYDRVEKVTRLEGGQSVAVTGPNAGKVTDTPASSAPATSSGPAGIRVEHSGDGTVVYGTERGDEAARSALKAQGFKWSRSLNGWYLPRTWSASTRELRVRGLEARLGDRVTVERGDLAKSGTAAERAAERTARAEELAQRHTQRAERAATEADVRFGRAHQIGDMIPMGQPILVGHHSEGRHRRDLARIDTNMRAGMEAQQRSVGETQAAASSAARAAMQTDPRAAARRLARSEAELRKVERRLNGTGKQIHGEDTPASGDYRTRLEARARELRDEIAHDRSIAGELVASGSAAKFGKHNVKPGDVVKVGGRGYVVHSTGPKNAKAMTEVGPLPYAYSQIQGVGKLDDVGSDALRKLLTRNRELERFNTSSARKLSPAIISRIEAILRDRGERLT